MTSEKSHSENTSISQLLEEFSSGSIRRRRALLQQIEDSARDLATLGPSLLNQFDPKGDDWSVGWILQVIKRHHPEDLSKILPSDRSDGWFEISSDKGINYAPLQSFLLEQQFEEADRYTSSMLRKLAGKAAEARGYVYFSEVADIPGLDLQTIDRLWIAYSQGKFGFTVQSRILGALSGRFERLWPRIGWKKDGVWTRYPRAFTWSLEAPEGHMPLVNQLRGVRLMDALLTHEGLKSRMK